AAVRRATRPAGEGARGRRTTHLPQPVHGGPRRRREVAGVLRGHPAGRGGGQAIVCALPIWGARDVEGQAGTNGGLRRARFSVGEGPARRSGWVAAARTVRVGRRSLSGRVLIRLHAGGAARAREQAGAVPDGALAGASSRPGDDEPVRSEERRVGKRGGG